MPTRSMSWCARSILRGRRYEIQTHGITLQENCADDLPLVWVDPAQIERALMNLVINAERALDEVPEEERMLMVTTRATDDGVAVDIADNGSGIPKHVLPRIFDPFFTTREVGQGTGLGLSMSHSIVLAHGGDLKVETEAGEGTTFTMELPRAAEDVDEAEKTIGGTRKAPDFVLAEKGLASSLKILVVDDEKEIRELARRFLTGKGHDVDEASTGREALKLVINNDYDGIVLDLRMPDLSGEGFFELVTQEQARNGQQGHRDLRRPGESADGGDPRSHRPAIPAEAFQDGRVAEAYRRQRRSLARSRRSARLRRCACSGSFFLDSRHPPPASWRLVGDPPTPPRCPRFAQVKRSSSTALLGEESCGDGAGQRGAAEAGEVHQGGDHHLLLGNEHEDGAAADG